MNGLLPRVVGVRTPLLVGARSSDAHQTEKRIQLQVSAGCPRATRSRKIARNSPQRPAPTPRASARPRRLEPAASDPPGNEKSSGVVPIPTQKMYLPARARSHSHRAFPAETTRASSARHSGPARDTMKHTGILDRDPRDALSLGIRAFPAGAHEPPHVHDDEGQLKWPRSHAMVSTPAGIYVLPPQWALWIPAGECHGGIYPEASQEHNVHIFTTACGELPKKCCAVRIGDPLERAVLSAMTERRLGGIERAERDRALLAVLRCEVKD